MDEKKVAILGGGHGGQTMAADLRLKGFRVTLCDLPQFANSQVFQNTMKGRKIEVSGVIQGVANIDTVTTNIGDALKDARVVFVIARSNADELFAKACAPWVEDGQTIVLGAGNCGSLVFANTFKEKKVKKDVLLAESASLPFGCRIRSPMTGEGTTKARVLFRTRKFVVGAFPAKRTDEVIARLKRLYPETTPARNIIEAGLSNPNPIVHCTPTILNIGRIERVDSERLGDFALFHEGFSESVIRAVIEVRKERENILAKFGWQSGFKTPTSTSNFLYNLFKNCIPKEGVEEAWKTKGPMGPISEARYITEDIPYGLVTYSSFGKMIGVETPTIDAVIQLSSVMNQKNYMHEGRTITRLGIGGMSIKKLNQFLYEGY
jgi:opine dehydrogenase